VKLSVVYRSSVDARRNRYIYAGRALCCYHAMRVCCRRVALSSTWWDKRFLGEHNSLFAVIACDERWKLILLQTLIYIMRTMNDEDCLVNTLMASNCRNRVLLWCERCARKCGSKHTITTILFKPNHDWIVSSTSSCNFDVVYIDFSRAFDSIVFSKLLAKLGHCGITGKLLNCISALIHNRERYVVLDTVFHRTRP